MKTDQTASVIRALLCGLNYRCAAGEQRRKQLERFLNDSTSKSREPHPTPETLGNTVDKSAGPSRVTPS